MIRLFQAAVQPAIQALVALGGCLGKAESHCTAQAIDPAALLGAHLAPDMLPLTRQVQIATDMIKNGCGRLAGMKPPSFPDTETSFGELQDRLDRTMGYILGLPPASIDEGEDRPITIKVAGNEMHFIGHAYLTSFVLPNFYFHCTASYLILRHNGVELGKRDYLGEVTTLPT